MIPDFQEPEVPPDDNEFTHKITVEYGRFRQQDESTDNAPWSVTVVTNAFFIGRMWNQRMIDFFAGGQNKEVISVPFNTLIWIHNFIAIVLTQFQLGIFPPDPIVKGIFEGLDAFMTEQMTNLVGDRYPEYGLPKGKIKPIDKNGKQNFKMN